MKKYFSEEILTSQEYKEMLVATPPIDRVMKDEDVLPGQISLIKNNIRYILKGPIL